MTIVDKYGFSAGVAAFLIWFVSTILLAKIERIQTDMHDHALVSAYYQEAMCRNLAILAGRPLAECAPPLAPTFEGTAGTFEKR